MSAVAEPMVAGWPLAGALVMVLLGERLRAARRREALNRALHELRRPLQLLALAPSSWLARSSSAPLELAIAALGQLDREVNGGGDVVVVAQKIVSKAEGRVVALSEVKPSDRAEQLAAELDKEAALVQLVLDESSEVLRAERGVLICETRQGLVCANAGVDTSNVDEGRAVLLPIDPDASARRIRAELKDASGKSTAVVVSDSFGRAWRRGQSEVAIGCAGLRPLDDWRGRSDAGGKQLSATMIAIADQAAAAADLVRDKASGVPATIVRGLERHLSDDDGPGAATLRRPRGEDLFR